MITGTQTQAKPQLNLLIHDTFMSLDPRGLNLKHPPVHHLWSIRGFSLHKMNLFLLW